jgi:hypothetical protein
MLVLALQNFARVVSLSWLNKLHFWYFRSSSWVELRLTQIFINNIWSKLNIFISVIEIRLECLKWYSIIHIIIFHSTYTRCHVLQNFARVVSLSWLNKLHFWYFRSSSWVELRLTQIFSMVPSISRRKGDNSSEILKS